MKGVIDMDIAKADIVRSAAGHDKGDLFAVLETDGTYALIADGKLRKIEKPKRKKHRHLLFEAHAEGRTADKLRGGEHITNAELRRMLAGYTAESC